mgnify:CR=1 FL=1
MKIFLDTDIGTDSDDAVCLGYLLANPVCELVGVTTLGPDAAVRADLVRAICASFERSDVPVVPGCEVPCLGNPYWAGHRVNQQRILRESPQSRPSTPADAVALMRAAIREHAGEVTLLSVGPLSNVAMLALADPQCLQQLKAVYTMTGFFPNDVAAPRTECNTMLDPAAAHVAFSRNLPNHTVFGLNVTGKLRLDIDAIERIFAGERLRPIRECCYGWIETKKNDPATGLHDPLAAACVFNPDFCTYERGTVRTRLVDRDLSSGTPFEDDKLNGFVYFVPDSEGPHTVAVTRDADRFLQHLEETFAAAS